MTSTDELHLKTEQHGEENQQYSRKNKDSSILMQSNINYGIEKSNMAAGTTFKEHVSDVLLHLQLNSMQMLEG